MLVDWLMVVQRHLSNDRLYPLLIERRANEGEDRVVPGQIEIDDSVEPTPKPPGPIPSR